MVAHIDERTAGEYTVRIDRSLCVGFGDCIDAAPAAFDLDAESIAIFRNPGEESSDRLFAACAACPIDALSLHDPSGHQIAPKSPQE